MKSRVRELDLGLPDGATDGYGTNLVGLPDRACVLFTFIDPPAAFRLVCFDLASSRGELVGNVRGELRDAVVDGDRVHALLTYGLYELSLSPLAVKRSLHEGLPDFANALRTGPRPGTLVVQRHGRTRAPVVDLSTYTLAGTVAANTLPPLELAPSIVLHVHKPMPRALPKPPVRQRSLGRDAKGREVIVRGRKLALLGTGGKPVAEIDAGVSLLAPTLAGPCTVVGFAKRGFCRSLVVVEWDGDAKRPVVETTPMRSRRAPKLETTDRGRTRHVNERIGRVVLRGGTLGGHDFVRCRFDQPNLDGRKAGLVVRDATLERCELSSTHLTHVTFEDCRVIQPKLTNGHMFYTCMFKHVTVVGDLGGRLRVYEVFDSDEKPGDRERARALLARYYRDIDWALDLRQADVSGIHLEGVPPALVRRDPERLLLVWAKHAEHPVWQSQEVAGWVPSAVTRMIRYEQPAAFVSLSKRAAPGAVAALRKAGVIDDETGVH